ncbi:unnamed protein product [Spirodela intermedia]|uniref:Uncharacterized protein n=1 Tax=Spirodela intermedia TaxID=51605 RepID=A0A7I8JGQ9_SPIIN|nr:unnamed protein product [Spirodela intermedia]CAA6668582.1 unnamed protein product [Spirodela intermedia]
MYPSPTTEHHDWATAAIHRQRRPLPPSSVLAHPPLAAVRSHSPSSPPPSSLIPVVRRYCPRRLYPGEPSRPWTLHNDPPECSGFCVYDHSLPHGQLATSNVEGE